MITVVHDITERNQRELEQEAIIKFTTALRSAHTRTDLLPAILKQVVELVHSNGAALGMRDSITGDTMIEYAIGNMINRTGDRQFPDARLCDQVIESGQPYLNNEFEDSEHFISSKHSRGSWTLTGVPLIASNEPIGVLWVTRKVKSLTSDLRLITAISDIAANAIQRATLPEDTQRRVQRLDTLHKIDLAITASMDLNVTLNILLDHVTNQLEVAAADILQLNPHTQTLYYIAGRGFRGDAITRTNLRLGEGCAGQEALERQLVAFKDLEEAECFQRYLMLSGEDFVAYYGVPLIAKGEIKGVLELFHREPFNPDHEWLNFLEMLSWQATIAIDGATMFDNLQRSNLELVAAYNTTLEGWARALELRDRGKEGHTRRVTEITMRLATAVRVLANELVQLGVNP